MNKTGKIRTQEYVCPWWLISIFDNPLRRLIQKPEKILEGLVKPGNDCLDLGCGFGYYTIAMAEMAGPGGSVTAVDIQPQMLEGTKRRAEKKGLTERIRLVMSNASNPEITGSFEFVLAFWMMHEVKDQESFVRNIYSFLNPRGKFLLVEPKIHVNKETFNYSVNLAEKAGLKILNNRAVFFSRAVLFGKK